MSKSRMFPFITKTWNPIAGGPCRYNCYGGGCWATGLKDRHNWEKYKGEYRIHLPAVKKKFGPDDFVFACDMIDIGLVPFPVLIEFLDLAGAQPAQILTVTKNPKIYIQLIDRGVKIPENFTLGATITSNRKYPQMSGAPSNMMRLHYMKELEKRDLKNKRFISVEPILDMDPYQFARFIARIKPWAVAVGYDNHNGKLPEPRLAATEKLIELLERVWMVKEERIIEVYRKTIRRAWFES